MRRISVNTPLLLSVASGLLAAAVTAAHLPALLGALFTPRLEQDPTRDRLAEYLIDHEADLLTYENRFNGRSLFVRPKPPPRIVPIVEAPKDEPQEIDPPPPPPPANYTGPRVLAVLGDEVWFQTKWRNGPWEGESLRLRVGQEGEGVKVIATDPPWTVRLGHAGDEYDVPLLERTFPDRHLIPPHAMGTIPGLRVVEPPQDHTARQTQTTTHEGTTP